MISPSGAKSPSLLISGLREVESCVQIVKTSLYTGSWPAQMVVALQT